MKLISTVLALLLGLGSVLYGAFLIHPGAALVALGLLALRAAVAIDRSHP